MVIGEQINVFFTHHVWLKMVLLTMCARKGTKGQKTTTAKLWSSNKIAYHWPTSQAFGFKWIWLVIHANYILEHGSFSWHPKCVMWRKAPCSKYINWPSFDNIIQLSLGASNGAQFTSPISVQTSLWTSPCKSPKWILLTFFPIFHQPC